MPNPPAKPLPPVPVRPPAAVQPAPPLPLAQIIENKRVAARLMRAASAGRLTFTNGDRDSDLLRQIAAQGFVTRVIGRDDYPAALFPNPAKPGVVQLATLRTLETLVNRSTAQKPCELLSFYRPPRAAGSREPHSLGFGLDIHAFGGWAIDNGQADSIDAVAAILAVLPPRAYRLGLPKAPGAQPHGLEPPPSRPGWAFFPPPRPRVIRLFGRIPVAMPKKRADGNWVRDRYGKHLRAEILDWENEHSAPLGDVGDARIRTAIRRAQRRGANIWMLFPDAADHLHIDMLAPK